MRLFEYNSRYKASIRLSLYSTLFESYVAYINILTARKNYYMHGISWCHNQSVSKDIVHI